MDIHKAIINDFYPDGNQVYFDFLLEENPVSVEMKTLPLSYFEENGIALTLDSQLKISVKDSTKQTIPAEDIIAVEVVTTPFGIAGFDRMKEHFPDVPHYSDEEIANSTIFKNPPKGHED